MQGALAKNAVGARVRKRQRLGVPLQEPDGAPEAGSLGRLPGFRHERRRELHADDVTAGLARELQRARAGSAGHVDDGVSGPDAEGPGQAGGESGPARMEALAEQEAGGVARVRDLAAGLEHVRPDGQRSLFEP